MKPTYERLTVISKSDRKARDTYWLCQCVCGTFTEVTTNHLTSGHTTSCGCWGKTRAAAHNTTHGLTKHPLFYIWQSVKDRCCNPNNIRYSRYGGRGISICKEWLTFQIFYDWAKGSYRKGLQIDRIDNDGNYEPSNCHWVSQTVNARNKSNTIWVNVDGERLALPEALERFGKCSYRAAYKRIKKGWDPIEAVSTPSSR